MSVYVDKIMQLFGLIPHELEPSVVYEPQSSYEKEGVTLPSISEKKLDKFQFEKGSKGIVVIVILAVVIYFSYYIVKKVK